MTTDCPFCDSAAPRVFLRTPDVIGLWDGYPVSLGHALLVPVRHVANWFEATARERAALVDVLDEAKLRIDASHHPDGTRSASTVGRQPDRRPSTCIFT